MRQAVPIDPPAMAQIPAVLPADAGIADALPASRPWLPWRVLAAVGGGWEAFFGVIALIGGLAFLAAVPVIQFLSLGYLLEVSGRVARTGRMRYMFIGVRPAARLGGMALGTYLWLLPLWLVASLARDAELIAPGSDIAQRWQIATRALALFVFLHVAIACARGGKLRWFFWPFNIIWLARQLWRGGYYVRARDAVWDFMMRLRLPYYFWLGLRGFAGAFLWLVLPVTLLALGTRFPALGILGALLLALVLYWLPFLQARFAAGNRLRAFIEIGAVRQAFRRAPWAHAFALAITFLLALPLFLLKIEVTPREALWLPALAFIVFSFPARVLVGWALARANRRSTPRHWFFTWTGRLAMLPIAALYILVLFFSQFLAWYGIGSLYEQHPFLLPVPFLKVPG
jgi:hypothetical protein